MKVIVGEGAARRTVELTNDTVIGRGGEGVIHKDPSSPHGKAFKIYHDPTSQRAKKLAAMCKMNSVFPKSVMGPLELARDTRGQVIGFLMNQLSRRFLKIAQIFKKSVCDNLGVTTKVKAEFFRQLFQTLKLIHDNGWIVGDLNDGGILIHTQKFEEAWIDVDSWAVDGYPCIVGTRLYLCPDLYGVDLSAGSHFKPYHDTWAMTVLLCRALLNGVHPFKSGSHPKWGSIMERAQNKATVFDKSVTYPDVGLPPEILTDDLTDTIIRILKGQTKTPFPLDRLEDYGNILVECKSCGTWYPGSRKACPACHEKTLVIIPKIADIYARAILVVKGRILHYQKDGSVLYCIAEESGKIVLYKKEGNKDFVRMETGIGNTPGASFGIFDGLVVMCPDPLKDPPVDLYILEVTQDEVRPFKSTTTESMAGGSAVFGCSSRFLYRIAGRTLLCSKKLGKADLMERPVMQVFEGQTWFTAATDTRDSNEMLFGFHRNMAQIDWFFVRGNQEGTKYLRFDVKVVPLEENESMRDFSIRFSEDSVLLVRKTRTRGIDRTRVTTISTDTGEVLKSLTFNDNEKRWDSIHGKAYFAQSVMHITGKEATRENLQTGKVTTLSGTGSFLSEDDSLDRFGNGILAIKETQLLLLEPKH